jgi:hypothetical protein
MVDTATKQRQKFICLIADIDCFDFEDIKGIQQIFNALYETDSNKIESVLKQMGKATVQSLLSALVKRDIANIIGGYLRLYTNSIVSQFRYSPYVCLVPASGLA